MMSGCFETGSFLLPELVSAGMVPWWIWLMIGLLICATVGLCRTRLSLLPAVALLGVICLGFEGQIRDYYRLKLAEWRITPEQKQRLGGYDFGSGSPTGRQRLTIPPIYVARREGEKVKAMTIADYGCQYGLLVKAEGDLLKEVPTESDFIVREIGRRNGMSPKERKLANSLRSKRSKNRVKMVNAELSLDRGFNFSWCRPLDGDFYYCEDSAAAVNSTGNQY